ncbi:hypothetical protein IU459_15905 [Nocardia amamiensis]|uniref:Ppx/GppA phosphatase domain-containing protein n=1 Tax=Nocardia amamiensis TaxID=404578 RepID=A0ABS0CQZ4_9NOCA|nr:hypothetical protein [Nocardia amamiensis]MBF6299017.1 hypothetical protein [Nocardia amamiensis]
MIAAWVAGTVRARTLLDRRLGTPRTRELAALPSLSAAQRVLLDSPYRRGIRPGQDLAETEHALAAALLWHLRVLAGWQPRAGARTVRLLAGGFEVANIVDHAHALSGATPRLRSGSARWKPRGRGCPPPRRWPNCAGAWHGRRGEIPGATPHPRSLSALS